MPEVARFLALVCTGVLGCAGDVVVETDIAYDERFAVAKLDVYSPPPRDTPRPAVVVIHGGGWREDEYRSYGYDFPPASVRLHQLEEVVAICRLMWTEPHPTFHGE